MINHGSPDYSDPKFRPLNSYQAAMFHAVQRELHPIRYMLFDVLRLGLKVAFVATICALVWWTFR